MQNTKFVPGLLVFALLALLCLFLCILSAVSPAWGNASAPTNKIRSVSWNQTVTNASTLITNALMPHSSKIMHVSLQTAPTGAALHANANPTAVAASTADQFAPAAGGEITFGTLHPETRMVDAVRAICSTSSCAVAVTVTYAE